MTTFDYIMLAVIVIAVYAVVCWPRPATEDHFERAAKLFEQGRIYEATEEMERGIASARSKDDR